MEYIIQIFAGGWHHQLYSEEEILEKLEHITEQIQVKALIIGWNLSSELYRHLGEYLKKKGIEMYLWLPVFSEIGELGDVDAVVDLYGDIAGKYELQEGESFEFFCPSSEKNTQLLLHIFETYFADCGFDGVFLDKIRSQSFVVGATGVMSCCCERCQKIYRDHGLDLERFRESVDKKGLSRMLRPAAASTWETVSFEETETEQFFKAKTQVYYEGIKRTVQCFRERGYKIGMDTFSPMISGLVGQDIRRLLGLADFIKPMIYRKTDAPAGIGFEYRMMEQAVYDPESDEDRRWDTPDMFSEAFMRQQLGVKDSDAQRRIYPGIEINYREDIARTDETYVKDSLRMVRNMGCGGAVLSWDVMLAPEEHIRCAADVQRRSREE
ncbi:MAG: hypothetical protein HFH53_01985 [Hespellia sp.]|nr:hypothetical protein [Hespellia sp.]